MSTTLKKIKYDGKEVQVESAVRDGNGNIITSTYLTAHPSITTSTDTTSTSSPSHGGTFTAVDSITRDSNGHVTTVNTKTITLPSAGTDHNQTVKGNGTAFGADAAVNIVGDGATTVTADTTNNKITISTPSVTDTNQKIKTSSVTFGNDDVVEFKGSSHITVTGNATNKDMTIGVESGYAIPTTSEMSGKQSAKPDGTNLLIDSSTSKINTAYIPDYILGQVVFGGTVNASTAVATLSSTAKSKLGTTSNTITLTNNTTATTGYSSNEGVYYVVSTAGTFASISFAIGDWLISTGSAWKKVDNTDEVTSVNGSTGAVTLSLSSADSSSTGSEQYLQDVTYTAASSSGSATFIKTINAGSGSLTSDSAEGTNGIKYVSEVSHTAPSLTDTKTFITDVGTFSAGSGSFTPTTKYLHFSAGTTPPSSASPTTTSTNSGTPSGTVSVASSSHTHALSSSNTSTTGSIKYAEPSLSGTVLTIQPMFLSIGSLSGTTTVATSNHTHTYDKATGVSLTSGTAPSLTANTTSTSAIATYIESAVHTHVCPELGQPTTGTVGITGGTFESTTKYLHHSHTGASSATTGSAVTGISGGSITKTTKHLKISGGS